MIRIGAIGVIAFCGVCTLSAFASVAAGPRNAGSFGEGQLVEIQDRDFVSIRHVNAEGGVRECAGTRLGDHHVLTAEHCFFGKGNVTVNGAVAVLVAVDEQRLTR